MLAEGFLRVLRYREERKFASRGHKMQTHTLSREPLFTGGVLSNSTSLQADSTEAGPNQEEPDDTRPHDLRMVPHDAKGVLIPGCWPDFALDLNLTVCLESCSLLEHYPDLQVADSGLIPHNPVRATVAHHGLYAPQPECSPRQELQGEPVPSISDLGYLVMGDSVNTSLDLPGSGLEPMSNSVLNGLLEKQLDEVYLQHLTDNLARCSSHLGNSLLHGLVPPLKPSSQPKGPDSLEVSLQKRSVGESGKKISYLSTQNLVPCSSNFSSPVLRISEADSAHVY